MQLSLSSVDPGHVTSHALKELILKHKEIGDNLPPCIFHGVLAKEKSRSVYGCQWEPKCTVT
jgi:hypothetical protein